MKMGCLGDLRRFGVYSHVSMVWVIKKSLFLREMHFRPPKCMR